MNIAGQEFNRFLYRDTKVPAELFQPVQFTPLNGKTCTALPFIKPKKCQFPWRNPQKGSIKSSVWNNRNLLPAAAAEKPRDLHSRSNERSIFNHWPLWTTRQHKQPKGFLHNPLESICFYSTKNQRVQIVFGFFWKEPLISLSLFQEATRSARSGLSEVSVMTWSESTLNYGMGSCYPGKQTNRCHDAAHTRIWTMWRKGGAALSCVQVISHLVAKAGTLALSC